MENKDPSSGKVYYANLKTKATSWTWPDELPAKDEASVDDWVERLQVAASLAASCSRRCALTIASPAASLSFTRQGSWHGEQLLLLCVNAQDDVDQARELHRRRKWTAVPPPIAARRSLNSCRSLDSRR